MYNSLTHSFFWSDLSKTCTALGFKRLEETVVFVFLYCTERHLKCLQFKTKQNICTQMCSKNDD